MSEDNLWRSMPAKHTKMLRLLAKLVHDIVPLPKPIFLCMLLLS